MDAGQAAGVEIGCECFLSRSFGFMPGCLAAKLVKVINYGILHCFRVREFMVQRKYLRVLCDLCAFALKKRVNKRRDAEIRRVTHAQCFRVREFMVQRLTAQIRVNRYRIYVFLIVLPKMPVQVCDR